MNRTVADCPNDHGPDGIIECWSPGGPCPDGRTVCEMCGQCQYCLEDTLGDAPEWTL